MCLPLCQQHSQRVHQRLVLRNVLSQLLRLSLIILTDPINHRDLLVKLRNNVPVRLHEVLGEVLAHVIGTALDPELVNHHHFVLDLHLLLGPKDHILQEIQLLADLQLRNLSHCRLPVLWIDD